MKLPKPLNQAATYPTTDQRLGLINAYEICQRSKNETPRPGRAPIIVLTSPRAFSHSSHQQLCLQFQLIIKASWKSGARVAMRFDRSGEERTFSS